MTDATTSRTDRPRILLYVQHLLGIGHQKRAATLTRALEAAGFAVTYVSGGFPVRGLDTGPADFVQLPPARAVDTNGPTSSQISRRAGTSRRASALKYMAKTWPPP